MARGGAAGVVDVGEVARVAGDGDARGAQRGRGAGGDLELAERGGVDRVGEQQRRAGQVVEVDDDRAGAHAGSAATARTMALACAGLGAARGRPRSSGSVQRSTRSACSPGRRDDRPQVALVGGRDPSPAAACR